MYLHSFSSKWTWVALVVMIQCKAVDSPENHEKELQKLVSKNIGIAYHSTYNESKTFVLCVQNIPAEKIGTVYISFLVIDMKVNSIVESGKYLHGHCKWINDSSIELIDMPGALKENQSSSDFKKIIVIKQLKTQSL